MCTDQVETRLFRERPIDTGTGHFDGEIIVRTLIQHFGGPAYVDSVGEG